jgi:Flp pilus assembly protein protease CpaA
MLQAKTRIVVTIISYLFHVCGGGDKKLK